MDNSYGLQRVQENNLRLLNEIDRICRKHGIRYMLDAGTLLGAVRHKGFIPWDDDADIVMRRESWEAFAMAVKNELPKDMELVTPEELAEDNKFYDFTPRLMLKTSRRHQSDEESAYYDEKLNHLWVDIFILDDLPESRLGAWYARTLQKVIYSFAMGHRRKLSWENYSFIHKIAVGVFSNIGKLFSMKSICRWQERAAKKDRGKETGSVYYSNYQPDYLYVTLEREWVEDTEYAAFEDTEYQIPKHWDEILTWVYGDYMKLPDEEHRKAGHGTTEMEFNVIEV